MKHTCKNLKIEIQRESDLCAEEWNQLAASLGGRYFHCCAETEYVAAAFGTEPLFLRALGRHSRCVAMATGTIWRPRHWPFSRYCGLVTLLSLPATLDSSRRFRCENTAESAELLMLLRGESMQRHGKSVANPEQNADVRRTWLASGRVDILVSYYEDEPVSAALFAYSNGRPSNEKSSEPRQT